MQKEIIGAMPKDLTQDATFIRFQEMLLDTDYDGLTKEEIAQELGVDRTTVFRWRKRVDWDWIKAERRRKYAKEMVGIDAAMIKAAQKGDVAAAKYVAERFDGYTPASTVHQIHEVDESLVDEELAALIERKRAALDAIANTNDPAALDAEGRGQTETAGEDQSVPKTE